MSATNAANVDLLYSEVEEQLREAVRDLLTDSAPIADTLKSLEGDLAYDPGLWSSLAGLGAAGLHLPEAVGGGGASYRETAVVMEEVGHSLAPTPFLGSAVLATEALAVCAPERLPELLDGTTTATLVLSFATSPWATPSTPVTVTDGALTGTVRNVADARDAEMLLVPARSGDVFELWAVPAANAIVEPVTSLDQTRPIADVVLRGAAGERLASGELAERAVHDALVAAAVLLASEQVGVAERCFTMALDYVRERKQFGRTIGSFQVIKHRLADLFVAVSQARAVARYAAACLAGDEKDLPVAVCLAQAFCSDLAVRAAEECVQLHGGIGFTWEHPAHLFLKRAKADQVALGSPDHHREALAPLVDLPGPPAEAHL
ncbi:MAG TPA: acyl-CoA dehydrogenase family protein [Mycobacteriales bacterium]|nr:acyl-CoA dehydrogenase family protein [Mycobacteriales bacterium]